MQKMKSLRPKQTVLFLVMMTLMILKLPSVVSRDPVLHRVGGGKSAWNPNSNFSDWSNHETFYVGDWLYFGFDKWTHNVLEVNETSYENCNGENYITNITRGGRDVFNLTEAKDYYFLCSRGYCYQGMKVQVSVIEFIPSPPLPPPMPALTSHADGDLQLSDGLSSYGHGFYAKIMVAIPLACVTLLVA